MPSAESYIMVHRPQQPNIIINGTNTVPREYHEFRQGVQVFPNLAVSIEPESYEYESKYRKCLSFTYGWLNLLFINVLFFLFYSSINKCIGASYWFMHHICLSFIKSWSWNIDYTCWLVG